jgi:hypothetical protein
MYLDSPIMDVINNHLTGPGTKIQDFLATLPGTQSHCFPTGPSPNKFQQVIEIRMTIAMTEDMPPVISFDF